MQVGIDETGDFSPSAIRREDRRRAGREALFGQVFRARFASPLGTGRASIEQVSSALYKVNVKDLDPCNSAAYIHLSIGLHVGNAPSQS